MDVVQSLHMVGGLGKTSYASNSDLQMKAIAKAKPLVEQALVDIYYSVLPRCMAVADLGCSSGPNALAVVAEIVEIVTAASGRLGLSPPEIQYFLNDLPGNDFNTLFRRVTLFRERLEQDYREGRQSRKVQLYASGIAGSYFDRLFPGESVHVVHSSYSLHFLSQVPRGVRCDEFGNPVNRRNIYLSSSSPHTVYQSYLQQFRLDFTSFLRLRSEETVPGGCMVLVFLGRGDVEPFNGECSHLWKLLADALVEMASEGLIEESNVDSFNLPFYAPSVEELEAVIRSQGSFDIVQLQVFQLNWDPTVTSDVWEEAGAVSEQSSCRSGENVAKYIRAVVESMLVAHFGESLIIDDLFSRYARNVLTHLSEKKTKYFNHSVFMKKKKKENEEAAGRN